ncbi:MAG TPA: alpha/beta fold hydrolase [Anaerolineaceae bacterium]
MPRRTVNGVELYYELHGPENADLLVLSNGILMSTGSWAYQLPVLSRFLRVLLYDCRGMWQSAHPAGPYTMEQHADDLAALLDTLNIAQAHIGGISYGGEISLAFALRHSDRVKSLVVASAVAAVDAEMRERTLSWWQAAQAGDPEALYQATYPLNFSSAWAAANQPLLQSARARYQKLDMSAFLELMGAFSRLDLLDDLSKITQPTLVMVGEQDILKPPKYSRAIAARIPNAEFVLVPDAGHAVSWEKPGVFNSVLLGFVLKHARSFEHPQAAD